MKITKELRWDGAHRILRHESKCGSLHGHGYRALVTVTAPQLDAVGRVIDFGVIKERVGTWIDEHWDHTTMLKAEDPLLPVLVREASDLGKRKPYVFVDEPTAENIALELLRHSRRLLSGTGVTVVGVQIFETPTSSAYEGAADE